MTRALAPALFVLLVVTASHASESTQTVTFGPDAGGKTKAQPSQPAVTLADDQLKVVVQCTGGLDCTKVGMALEMPGGGRLAKTLQAEGSDRTVVLAKGELSAQPMKVLFTFNNIDIPSGTFTVAASGGGAAPPPNVSAAAADPLPDLVLYPCKVDVKKLSKYDLRGDVAEIIVNPLGQVLASNADAFDENDTLRVTVLAHPDLVRRLRVERTSEFRDRTEIRILGEGATRDQIRLEAGAACEAVTFELSDFAPGRGQVDISVLSDTLEKKSIGAFDLYVDPLYIGIFSSGAFWTKVVDPEIGLASNGTGNVVAAKADSDHDLLYGVLFTPFVWGRRDVEKSWSWYRKHDLRYPYWQHFNPTIGFPFDHVNDNVFVGVSLDLPRGFLVTYGKHFGEIKTLDPASGLALGSPFTGTEDSLPLVKDRVDETFFAVTVDLRVFVRLLQTVVTGGTK